MKTIFGFLIFLDVVAVIHFASDLAFAYQKVQEEESIEVGVETNM